MPRQVQRYQEAEESSGYDADLINSIKYLIQRYPHMINILARIAEDRFLQLSGLQVLPDVYLCVCNRRWRLLNMLDENRLMVRPVLLRGLQREAEIRTFLNRLLYIRLPGAADNETKDDID